MVSLFKKRRGRFFQAIGGLVALIAAVGVAILVIDNMGSEIASQPLEDLLPKDTDMRLEGEVKFSEVVEGDLVWELRSHSVSYSYDTGILLLEWVEAIKFSEGKPKFTVNGNEGAYDTENRELLLTGNVTGKNHGYTLRTESLKYSVGDEIATSEEDVLIVGEGIEMKGTGMFLSLKEERLTFKENARLYASPASIRQGEEDQ